MIEKSNLPAEVVDLCNLAGQPTMAASLIREGVTLDVARERLNYAGHVHDVVALARRTHPSASVAADFAERAITARMPVSQVTAALFETMADADEALPLEAHRRTGDGRVNAQQMSRDDMKRQIKAAGQEPVQRRR